ncbi:MAG: ABC transporter permease [Eubacteriales bacterium]|nr:ABC transporter permease [Eubacteriales bacterium]
MSKKTNGITADKVTQTLLKYGIYLLLLAMILVLSITCPSFRTVSNLSNVLLQVTTYAVLGIGMTFVIMTGGIDVSIGGIMVCCGSAYVVMAKAGVPAGVSIAVMFIISILFGVFNGVSVAYFGMPAFLATLATQCVGRGISLVLTGGASFRDLDASFTFFGKTKVLTIPLQVWVIVVLFVIGYLILHKTVYGRQITAVGGNLHAARVSGINDRLITCSAYVIMGLMSGIAGYLNMSRLGSYYASMGDGIEFMVIAAVVIGGTSMTGGIGTMVGTVVGTLIIGIINNALNLFHVAAEWQDVAKGVIIFLAVLFDAFKNRAKKSD